LSSSAGVAQFLSMSHFFPAMKWQSILDLLGLCNQLINYVLDYDALAGCIDKIYLKKTGKFCSSGFYKLEKSRFNTIQTEELCVLH